MSELRWHPLRQLVITATHRMDRTLSRLKFLSVGKPGAFPPRCRLRTTDCGLPKKFINQPHPQNPMLKTELTQWTLPKGVRSILLSRHDGTLAQGL